MNFKFSYFRTRERKGEPVREYTRYNIGDWRFDESDYRKIVQNAKKKKDGGIGSP